MWPVSRISGTTFHFSASVAACRCLLRPTLLIDSVLQAKKFGVQLEKQWLWVWNVVLLLNTD